MNDGIDCGFGGQTRDDIGQRQERAGQSNRAEHKR